MSLQRKRGLFATFRPGRLTGLVGPRGVGKNHTHAAVHQGAPLSTEMEHEVEAEEEQEAETELEIAVEMEAETEEQKAHESQSLGKFPRRKTNETRHSLAETGQNFYNAKILFSDSFMPLSRKETKASRQRALFDEAMYRVGPIFVALEMREDFSSKKTSAESPQAFPIKQIVIEDPLEDSILVNQSRSGGFFYDIRTGLVIRDLEPRAFNEKKQSTERMMLTLASPQFHTLIAQVKFFDGQMNGYTEKEENALADWLKSDPERMRNHFFDEIMKFRFAERKQGFPGSQLEAIFLRIVNR